MNAENAMEHMIAICARLNADTVTSIRDPNNLLEMHHHVSKPIDEIIALPPSKKDNFAHEIALITDYIQIEIQDVLASLVTDILDFDEELIKLPLIKPNDTNGSSKASLRYN
uniref:Uncharacterized protein n=1 Tax=Panagrolaimus sp. ES5 TaxID=591445 RepID=A0AC34GMI9_9BILA